MYAIGLPTGMMGYDNWHYRHDPSKFIQTSFTTLMGRCFEAEPMLLWYPPLPSDPQGLISLPTLSRALLGILQGREYSTATDERILESKSFYWADSRTDALAIAELNGVPTAAHDPARVMEHRAEHQERAQMPGQGTIGASSSHGGAGSMVSRRPEAGVSAEASDEESGAEDDEDDADELARVTPGGAVEKVKEGFGSSPEQSIRIADDENGDETGNEEDGEEASESSDDERKANGDGDTPMRSLDGADDDLPKMTRPAWENLNELTLKAELLKLFSEAGMLPSGDKRASFTPLTGKQLKTMELMIFAALELTGRFTESQISYLLTHCDAARRAIHIARSKEELQKPLRVLSSRTTDEQCLDELRFFGLREGKLSSSSASTSSADDAAHADSAARFGLASAHAVGTPQNPVSDPSARSTPSQGKAKRKRSNGDTLGEYDNNEDMEVEDSPGSAGTPA